MLQSQNNGRFFHSYHSADTAWIQHSLFDTVKIFTMGESRKHHSSHQSWVKSILQEGDISPSWYRISTNEICWPIESLFLSQPAEQNVVLPTTWYRLFRLCKHAEAVGSRCECTDWQCTCDKGGLVGVTAHSSDCSGNIYDQICLFGVQASAVQVPRTNTGHLSAPVSIVNPTHQKNTPTPEPTWPCAHYSLANTLLCFQFFEK